MIRSRLQHGCRGLRYWVAGGDKSRNGLHTSIGSAFFCSRSVVPADCQIPTLCDARLVAFCKAHQRALIQRQGRAPHLPSLSAALTPHISCTEYKIVDASHSRHQFRAPGFHLLAPRHAGHPASKGTSTLASQYCRCSRVTYSNGKGRQAYTAKIKAHTVANFPVPSRVTGRDRIEHTEYSTATLFNIHPLVRPLLRTRQTRHHGLVYRMRSAVDGLMCGGLTFSSRDLIRFQECRAYEHLRLYTAPSHQYCLVLFD